MNPPSDWWDKMTTAHGKLSDAIGSLAVALHRMTPHVIESRTVQLDANGQATGQERVPYKCLTVDSQSAKALTVVNAPLGTAPPQGPGVFVVRIGGYTVANVAGYSWSVYGGNPGEQVTVTAYGNPQPPYAR